MRTHARQELLVQAVVEGARHLTAALLVEERETLRSPEHEPSTCAIVDRDQALQDLRDALFAERRMRGEGR